MLGCEVRGFLSQFFPLRTQEPQHYWSSPQQSTSYYPFGLWRAIPMEKMPELSYIANGADEDTFTYNGKELEDEFAF